MGRAGATAAAVAEARGIGVRSGDGTTVAPTRVTTRALTGIDGSEPIGRSWPLIEVSRLASSRVGSISTTPVTTRKRRGSARSARPGVAACCTTAEPAPPVSGPAVAVRTGSSPPTSITRASSGAGVFSRTGREGATKTGTSPGGPRAPISRAGASGVCPVFVGRSLSRVRTTTVAGPSGASRAETATSFLPAGTSARGNEEPRDVFPTLRIVSAAISSGPTWRPTPVSPRLGGRG